MTKECLIADIDIGDRVDFGSYGRLYVIGIDGDNFLVTDVQHDRDNPDASCWNIKKRYAVRIVEKLD